MICGADLMQSPHKQHHTTRQRPVKPGQERKQHTKKSNTLRYGPEHNIQRVTRTQRPQALIRRGKYLQGLPSPPQHWVTGRWNCANHSVLGRTSKTPRHPPHWTPPLFPGPAAESGDAKPLCGQARLKAHQDAVAWGQAGRSSQNPSPTLRSPHDAVGKVRNGLDQQPSS